MAKNPGVPLSSFSPKQSRVFDAAWELKERFTEHWGAKLLRALHALHNLYVSGIDPSEKE